MIFYQLANHHRGAVIQPFYIPQRYERCNDKNDSATRGYLKEVFPSRNHLSSGVNLGFWIKSEPDNETKECKFRGRNRKGEAFPLTITGQVLGNEHGEDI